jgi:N-acetylmuramoyl-L-alanine amidase|nr:MAG TPA: Cell wall hydrolase autolysin [Caudoviricetes sp.]
MKVYLSPSDQWSNIVAGGKHSEAFHCIKIADYARAYLELNGYDVKVGSSDKENTYKDRVKESNEWGADLHIPIHTNGGRGHGTLMLCYPTRINNAYVYNIYKEVAELTPTEDKGIQSTTSLYEINATKCVTAYLESEFHDNEDTEDWIDNHEKELGRAIAKGVCIASGKAHFAELTNLKKFYKVQVGAFHNRKNAEKLKKELTKKGYNCYIVEG